MWVFVCVCVKMKYEIIITIVFVVVVISISRRKTRQARVLGNIFRNEIWPLFIEGENSY